MKKFMVKMGVVKGKVVTALKSEDGNLPDLGWEAGALAVVIVVIVALVAYMPDTIIGLLQDALDWAKDQIGF